MADKKKKPPLHPHPPFSAGTTNEHEFSADLEHFSADFSFNLSHDLESQTHATAQAAAANSKGQSSDTSFEMVAMGSPVMSRWRWIGEKELQYLVTNRTTHAGNSTSVAELAKQQPSPAVLEAEILEKGAFVRVVTKDEAAQAGDLPVDAGGVPRQKTIAHILLPTELVSSSPGSQEDNSPNDDLSSRETKGLPTTGGKKRKVASVDDNSFDQDLEKGLAKADTAIEGTSPGAAAANNNNDEEGFVCRVCHLTRAEPSKSEFMELGCACKLDLAHAHRDCAETWFRVRGNRQCEICGETAQNVRLLEPVGGSLTDGSDSTSVIINVHPTPSACWQNRPIRNFLLIFLVTAFLVPWLFRFAYYQFSSSK